MNVLVFSPYALWCPTFEYELEICQTHLDAGDRVAMAVCNAILPTCDVNPQHRASLCSKCIGRRLFGLAQLSEPIEQIPITTLPMSEWKSRQPLPTHFSDLRSLKSLSRDNFDLGLATMSSLVTATREPKPDLSEAATLRLLRRFLHSAYAVYRSLQSLLEHREFHRVYVLNGRLAILRAVLRACQFSRVDCYTHERGWDLEHYSLHPNTTIHDLIYLEALIRDAWEAADPTTREEVAADYYLKRAAGEGFNWHSFVDDQEPGALPEDWDSGRKNLVLFTSSDDELVALGDAWNGPVYDDQTSGIQAIADSLAGRGDCHLYIRVHPNLQGVENSTTRALAQIRGDHVTVIGASAPTCSYTLLREAFQVITFSSRMGVEATFWNVPSILVGQAPFRNLGSTYNPSTHKEVLELLGQDLPPRDKLGALQYGYFFRTFGQKSRFFELTGYCQGKYRSVALRQTGLFEHLTSFLVQRRGIHWAVSQLSAVLDSVRLKTLL